PEWLRQHVQPDWADRYRSGWDDTRLPSKQAERDVLVAQVGADGLALLDGVHGDDAPPMLRTLPAIQLLRKVWVQNYVPIEGGLRWRTNDDGLPPATQFISSPYDPEAHLALKQSTAWVGYKVHLTETCEPETPNLITQVQTVLAPIADWDSLPLIHQGLAKRALLPNQHLVDSGYVDADLLVASRRDFGIDLVGPPRHDHHWQAGERGGGRASQPGIPGWMGSPSARLPKRTQKRQLDPGDRQPPHRGYQDPLLREGLLTLPEPYLLRPVQKEVSAAVDYGPTAARL